MLLWRSESEAPMGLDGVEIVLEIEDLFGISIPDDRAEKCDTVGKTVDCIVDLLLQKPACKPVCPSAHTFRQLRRELWVRCGTPRTLVRLDVPVGGLVAPEHRHRWNTVAHESGLREEPFGWLQPRFPPPQTTVREVIRTRRKTTPWWRIDRSLDEEQVYRQVRSVISKQLGIPEDRITRASHFIDDLGMD